MRDRLHRFCSALFLASMVALVSLAHGQEGQAFAGNLLTVEVRSAKLRSSPRAWAPAVVDLVYGDQLEEVARDSGWVEARKGAAVGFVHETALTTRTVVLAAGSRVVDPTAQGGQVVLAGKGFADAVELKVATDDPTLNFQAVDALEKFNVQPEDLRQFLAAGQLATMREGQS